jgi:hypothetical protein
MKRELISTDHLGVSLNLPGHRSAFRIVKWGVIALFAFDFLLLPVMWYLEVVDVVTLGVIAVSLAAAGAIVWFILTHVGWREIGCAQRHPQCPACKYDLTGLNENSVSRQGRRCPECGQLNDVAAESCNRCSYALQGLPEIRQSIATTCPECGHHWQLTKS